MAPLALPLEVVDVPLSEEEVREELGYVGEDELKTRTILRLLGEEGSVVGAARRGAEILRRKYAQLATRSIGDVRIAHGERAREWAKIAEELRERQASLGRPFVGGISKGDKEKRAADGDRPRDAFWRGMW